MRRILGLEQLSAPLPRSVVTVGKFFAVHRGHQALMAVTVEAARTAGAESVVVTFDRHPSEVLRPGLELPLLASLEERLDYIEQQGVDVAVVVRLNSEFMSQEPEAFVHAVLVDRLRATVVVASEGFRFGRGATGDLSLLRTLGSELEFAVREVEPLFEGGQRISSSRVAACIEAGEVAAAQLLLGRPFSVPGVVVAGEQLGRQLGFPTANVQTPPRRLLPADGVYAVQVSGASSDGGLRLDRVSGAANLGFRPTVRGSERLLEVHLLDWSGDLSQAEVRVEFVDRLRDEQRFPTLDALKAQIAQDVAEARSRLAQAEERAIARNPE
jgi:riboflavin kinase/FMN adenylyltransferase